MRSYSELRAAMAGMPVLDAHEHLSEERKRTEAHVDAFTMFSHYTQTDLRASGMSPEDYTRTQDSNVLLDEKWRLVEPYWQRIRHGSYARAMLLSIREFYGFEDLNAATYAPLSEAMQAANTPGLYDRVLRESCHIEKALTQIGRIPQENRDLLVPLLPTWEFTGLTTDSLHALEASTNHTIETLADYLATVREKMEQWKADGVVGVKMMCGDHPLIERAQAEKAFDALVRGEVAPCLADFVLHEMLDAAGEMGLVVAVHCGIIWDNWNNPYSTHPRFMVPVLMAHRHTKFDLYHAAIPWYGDMGVLAKDFPNAYLNMAWCHIVSQQMSVGALDQWIDLVPVNKILGFGGDYAKPVEKVFGHLEMAKEDIAAVLARRVDAGLMNTNEAIELCRMFLHDNAIELYGL